MARIPIIPTETSPIIAPALAAANQIREGRSRAAISEMDAQSYPERQRLAMTQAQQNIAAGEFQARQNQRTEDTQAPVEDVIANRKKAEQRADELNQYTQILRGIDTFNKLAPGARTPEELNKNVIPVLEKMGFPASEILKFTGDKEDYTPWLRDKILGASKMQADYNHKLALEVQDRIDDRQLKQFEQAAKGASDGNPNIKPMTGSTLANVAEKLAEEYYIQGLKEGWATLNPDKLSSVEFLLSKDAPNKEAWVRNALLERARTVRDVGNQVYGGEATGTQSQNANSPAPGWSVYRSGQ